jgi:hypothetical protein
MHISFRLSAISSQLFAFRFSLFAFCLLPFALITCVRPEHSGRTQGSPLRKNNSLLMNQYKDRRQKGNEKRRTPLPIGS